MQGPTCGLETHSFSRLHEYEYHKVLQQSTGLKILSNKLSEGSRCHLPFSNRLQGRCNVAIFRASTSRSVSTSDWNPQSLTALCSKGIQLLALSVWLSKTSDLSPEVMIALSNAKIWFSYRISPVTWLPTGPEVTKVEAVRMRSQGKFSKNLLCILDYVCLFIRFMHW